MDTTPTRPYKAIFAGFSALLGGLSIAYSDGALTAVEIIVILSSVLLAVGGVYGITNPPTTAAVSNESNSTTVGGTNVTSNASNTGSTNASSKASSSTTNGVPTSSANSSINNGS